MKKIILFAFSAILISSCSVYKSYERPSDISVENLYQHSDTVSETDTTSLGDIPWQELFSDAALQKLIKQGIEGNTDLQVALLRLDQAKSQLTAAKLAFLPSLTFSPSGTISKTGSNAAVKSYELPVQASWEIDLFGSLRNAKKGAQATLLEQEAYRQAVQSELVANIANSYYSLLLLDKEIEISQNTLTVWEEQVRAIEAMLKVGEETENALTQARASLYELEATHNDLIRQQREAENALCTLLGITCQTIERGTLDEQVMPEQINTGIPLRLLSNRPDVAQAEMTLANAFYATNKARSAFYPNLTLSGSIGWTNSVGEAVTNPGTWIMSAVASLTQPIFNRGQLKSNLQVAKDDEEIAKLNYKQAILEAGQDVNDALYAVQSAQRSFDIHTKQCNELERTVKTAQSLYETANATYLELLSARQSLLNAQLSVATDQFTSLQAVVNLYKALGGGRI